MSFWGTKWRRIFSLSILRRSFAFAQDDIERNLDSVSDTLSCHSDFDGYGLFWQSERAALCSPFSVSINPFRHAGRLLKKFRKPSKSRLSAYIGTVGRELRRKSKSLRSKQDYNKIVPYMSFWGTKWRRIFSLSILRRSFAFAQDDIERNLDSVSDTLSCHSDFDGYGLFWQSEAPLTQRRLLNNKNQKFF